MTNRLAAVDLHRFQECILDAIPGVCMISDEAVDRALDHSHVLAYHRFPIGHAQVLVKTAVP